MKQVLLNTDVGKLYYDLEDRGITPGVIRTGTYEHADEEKQFLNDILKPGDVFFDVGAHVGFFSKLALNIGCSIYAFEPDHINYELLQLNLVHPSTNVHLYNVACGDQYRRVGVRRTPIHSGDHRVNLYDDSIEMYTLDKWMYLNPKCIKIDTQGWDHRVVMGVGERKPPYMIVEYSPGHIIQMEDDPHTVLDYYFENFNVEVLHEPLDVYKIEHPSYTDLVLTPL